MSAKFYLGYADHTVRVLTAEGIKPLRPRNDLANHSPTGFSWGYGGSGPAQLALALLADALEDDERAKLLHQPFKWQVTAALNAPCWVLSAGEVRAVAVDLWKRELEHVGRTGQSLCTQA